MPGPGDGLGRPGRGPPGAGAALEPFYDGFREPEDPEALARARAALNGEG